MFCPVLIPLPKCYLNSNHIGVPVFQQKIKATPEIAVQWFGTLNELYIQEVQSSISATATDTSSSPIKLTTNICLLKIKQSQYSQSGSSESLQHAYEKT